MLFWLFVIILLVGIGIWIWYDNFCSHYKCWIETLYVILNSVGIAGIIISVVILAVNFTTIDADIKGNQQIYNSLIHQYENAVFDTDDDAVGKKELYNQIQEWNKDLAWHKSAQRSFWIGIYIPNIYDRFDFIELTPHND